MYLKSTDNTWATNLYARCQHTAIMPVVNVTELNSLELYINGEEEPRAVEDSLICLCRATIAH